MYPDSVDVPAAARSLINSKRITVEADEDNAETVLLDVLKKSGFSYEFDPGLYAPSGQLDFTANFLTLKVINAPAARALDAVTRAAGIGWTAETSDALVVIRIVRLKKRCRAMSF